MTSRSPTSRFWAWHSFPERELSPFRPLLQHRRLDGKPPVQGLLDGDSRSGSLPSVQCSDDGDGGAAGAQRRRRSGIGAAAGARRLAGLQADRGFAVQAVGRHTPAGRRARRGRRRCFPVGGRPERRRVGPAPVGVSVRTRRPARLGAQITPRPSDRKSTR